VDWISLATNTDPRSAPVNMTFMLRLWKRCFWALRSSEMNAVVLAECFPKFWGHCVCWKCRNALVQWQNIVLQKTWILITVNVYVAKKKKCSWSRTVTCGVIQTFVVLNFNLWRVVFVWIMHKDSVRTSQRTQLVFIVEISWLKLYR
jgi:hypothetical protein